SDARFAFVVESVSRDEFRERWPNADCVDFEGSSEYGDWFGQKEVRIAEYWSRKPVKREMLQLSDGRVVAADDWTETEGVEVVNRRKVDTYQLTMEIVSGKETLEGPFDWPTPDIPIIPVWGDIVTADGRDLWSGMVR